MSACWNGFCVLTGCDGENHTDTTGMSWAQRRGNVYCPVCRSYRHGPDECPHGYESPVFTDYERGLS